MNKKQNQAVLFVAYTNLANPIIWSQGIPLLKEMIKKGWRVFLLTFENEDLLKTNSYLKEMGAIEWRFLFHRPFPILPSFLDLCRGIIYIFWLIKKEKISIVHVRSYLPGVIAYFLKKLTGASFIFDMRGLAPEEEVLSGHWSKNSLPYKLAKFWEKKIIFQADFIVVITNSFKHYVEEKILGKKDEKIKVIPICVEASKFHGPLQVPLVFKKLKEKKKFILVYSGAFENWHLIDKMIDFFHVLKERVFESHFLILTYQKERAENFLLKNLKEEDYTVLTVRPNEMPAYLNVCDLAISFIQAVFPKNIASFPIKFVEYLASGLPIVVNSGIFEIEEIVNKFKIGVVIEDFNKYAYQIAVQKLLAILNERENIKIRTREIVNKKYNLNLAIQKYEEIYEALVGYV